MMKKYLKVPSGNTVRGIIRRRNSMDRQHNGQKKRRKRRTMVDKIPQRKLQMSDTLTNCVNSDRNHTYKLS